jgi:hypothetical protein
MAAGGMDYQFFNNEEPEESENHPFILTPLNQYLTAHNLLDKRIEKILAKHRQEKQEKSK